MTKKGCQTPRGPKLSFKSRSSIPGTPTPLRQKEAYVNLTTAVLHNLFKEALIAFIVVCQMAFSLVANLFFLFFLQTIYPLIGELIPGCSNTIRA